MIDVVGEDPLDDPPARVNPFVVLFGVTDFLVERVDRPAVQAVLNDPKCRVQSLNQLGRAEDVLEIVVSGAVVRGIGEARRVRAGLAGSVSV